LSAAVGVYVQQVDAAAPLLSANDAAPMNPASTMKLLTTDAALDLLGPAYTWKTQAYASGTRDGDVLNGDLVIKGSGDPKLVTENLWLFLRRIRAAGIREIRGNVVLDRSAFADVPYDPALFDGDPIKPYNAGPDALLLNYKSFAVRFTPRPELNRVDVSTEPPAAGWHIEPPSLSGGACIAWQDKLQPALDSRGLAFAGSFSAVCGDKTWYIHPYLTTSLDYFGMVFRRLWTEVGGSLSGNVVSGTTPPDASQVAEWQSPSLAEVIRDINKYSNNVMARQLLLTIAKETGGMPATTGQGAAVVRSWLASEGIDTAPLAIENGAGLSRIERVSAGLLGRMLLAAYQSPTMPELMSSLPLVANDGTMRKRLAMEGVAGRAHIKTGSLADVRAIAGYVLAASGKRYVVVGIVNHPNAGGASPALDALLEWVYQRG
ncbi:MAG TPA: D-alanyl-D-alanine carboxypeptidase/D-alanyl-D-alanine-endopeptidase, partial [Oxalicibacterium sp.]|nr:D-alanyl-D-alanine carboxypeptidase/D-alanyl-D-alanine-endopeptidase [Oxalicibacterium sp.]